MVDKYSVVATNPFKTPALAQMPIVFDQDFKYSPVAVFFDELEVESGKLVGARVIGVETDYNLFFSVVSNLYYSRPPSYNKINETVLCPTKY